MFRARSVLLTVVVMTLVGVCSVSVSGASPPTDAANEACPFVLSPPEVVQVSVSSMVMAKLGPGPCRVEGIPNESVVCLAIEGDSSAGQCANMIGAEPAVLYYPYQRGATYVVTGRGCSSFFERPHTVCGTVGPAAFTL